jgi:hypothetical protein
MATTSVPVDRRESTTRGQRGCGLYREHAEEITFEDGIWYVPSQHDVTSVYEVVLGRRGDACECEDFEYRHPEGGCLHIIAATIARAKTRQCAGCGQRFPHREIVEVSVGHESLVFFIGDPVCTSCGLAHGLL